MPTSTLCRVCVSEQSELVNMLNLYYGSTPATTFIMDILQIKVDSEGSSALVMCSSCNTTLNNFYSFYNMVRDAQHKYNQIKVQDGMTREISFIDIKPHTSFIDCKVEDEYMIDCDNMDYMDIPSTSNLCKTSSSPAASDETMSVQPLQDADTLPICRGQAMDNGTESLSDGGMDPDNKPIASLLSDDSKELLKSRLKKKKIGSRKKKEKKNSSDCSKTKRKKNLRSEKATKAILTKYKVEEIYSDGEWRISQKEKDEIFKLYIDMKCSACAIELSTYNELEDHSMAKHDTSPVVSCDNLSFTSYESMERHILYKHILNSRMPRIRPRIPCKVCSKLIIDCHMRQHLSSHLPHDKREFQCNQCHAGFGTKSALKSHISLNHEATQVPCSECGKMFRNIYHVTQHKKRVHGPSDNVHLCPECGKKYKDFTMFTNHVNEHYGIVERVKCATCQVIIKRACLSKHMRIHDIKNQKQCPHCPYKGFQIREHVKRAHEKLKPHACQFCPKKFYNDKGLKDHMASCHTGIPEYSCEFCGATFMSSGNCHSHRKKMHPTHWAMQKMEKANKLNADNIPVCDASTLLRNKHFLKGAEAEQVIQDLKNRKKKIKT